MNPVTPTARPKSWEKIVDFSVKNQTEQIRIKGRTLTTQTYGILGGIKAFTSGETVSEQRSITRSKLKIHLDRFLQFQVNGIVEDLQLTETDAVAIRQKLDAILDNVDLNKSKRITGKEIALAHSAAQHALLALRNDFIKPNVTRILPFIEKDPSGVEFPLCYRVSVLEAAPRLANLVLSGGGMKGQAYVPVMKTLESTGIRKDLQHIAGTSAGALTAGCIATGMSAAAYKELVQALDMLDQMRAANKPQKKSRASKDGYAQNGSAIRQDKSAVRFSAEKLLLTCQSTLRANVMAFHSAHERMHDTSGLEQMKKNSVLKLHTKIKTASDYQPTFADLALLHEYDPDNFKKLTLTGFNKTDQKLEIFDAATWPDLPIATAMRISMAIPGIIDPIILNKNGRDLTMIDGGVNANLPTHLVDPFATGSTLSRDGITDTEKDAIVASTIALSFAHGGKGQKALDQGADSIQMPWYKRIYATFMAPNKIEAFRDDTQRFVERGLNGLLADNDKLETLSFGASKEAIDAAHVTAEVRFIDSLRRNGVADRDRAMYRTYATIDEAVSTIKEADLRAFLQTPLPADPSDAIVQFTAAAKAHIDEIDLKRSKTQAS